MSLYLNSNYHMTSAIQEIESRAPILFGTRYKRDFAILPRPEVPQHLSDMKQSDFQSTMLQ